MPSRCHVDSASAKVFFINKGQKKIRKEKRQREGKKRINVFKVFLL